MAELKVLLADENKEHLRLLGKLINLLRPRWNIVASLHGLNAAAEAMATLVPDLCVLDIRFVETVGMEATRELHANHTVIYVTADASGAVRAFDLSAVDFVVKPLGAERFEQALSKAEKACWQARKQKALPRIAQTTGVSMVRMLRGAELTVARLDQVRYFQAESKYTRVVLQNQEGRLQMGLSAIERNVNPGHFWRINRGYVINARWVTLARRDEVGRLFVRLRDRLESLPVARPYESLFRDGFS